MPEKKAAKKTVHKVAHTVSKKVAKKSAKHAKEHGSKDLRRAFEHLGRVTILEASLTGTAAAEITTLAAIAQQEIHAGHAEEAAELLRAAEHLCFGELSDAAGKAGPVSEGLTAAIDDEFERRTRKAADHWDDDKTHHAAIEAIYTSALTRARTAYNQGKLRRALEFARAADALARVKVHSVDELPAPVLPKLAKGKSGPRGKIA